VSVMTATIADEFCISLCTTEK